jgi:hypothetical protein
MNDASFTDRLIGPVVGVYQLGRRMASARNAVEVSGLETLQTVERVRKRVPLSFP